MTATTAQFRVEHDHQDDYQGLDWHVMSADEADGCYGSYTTRIAEACGLSI